MTDIKRLRRKENGDFKRNFTGKSGTKYTIRTQEEGIGLFRYSRLLNMSSVWGFQADFGSQVSAWRKAVSTVDQALIGKASFGDFFAVAQSAVDGITRSNETNYIYAYWTACLFITAEGEDLTKFVEAEQQLKIDDWAASLIHEQDFEDLVKKKLIEFSRRFEK